MADTYKTALIGGLFAVLGAVGGAATTGWLQVKLAEQKFNSDLVLKALESDDPVQRLESLKFLVETNLIKDDEVKQGVRSYAYAKQDNPETIPRVSPKLSFEAPVVSNARIYLLSGNTDKDKLFSSYREELEQAGYRVLGEKHIEDIGRPKNEEVRYFHAEDRLQAEKIAEVLKFKLSLDDLPAKQYSDRKANPGYIEIWFGK